MVTMLGYLPISQYDSLADELWDSLNESQRDKLAELGEEALNLLAPMVQVSSESELKTLLPTLTSRFTHIKIATLQVLLPEEEISKDLKELLGKSYRFIYALAETEVDLLGEEALQQFIGALESAEGLNDRVFEAYTKGESAVHRLSLLMPLIAEPALYADITITAVQIILLDLNTDWTPHAIPVLCRAADNYMTMVEDVFLGESSPVEQLGKTISYDTVRKSLGL